MTVGRVDQGYGNSKREINVAAPVLTFGAILTFVFGLFLSLFQLSSLGVR